MVSLLTECPKTREPIDVGINIDRKSLASSWSKSVIVRCPHCNEEHTVKVREAFVQSEISNLVLGR
jgi:hypothetical protein